MGAEDGNEFLDGDVGLRVSRPDAAQVSGIIIEGNHFGRSSMTSKSGAGNAILFVNVANSRIGGPSVSARNTFIGCRNCAVVIIGPASTENDIQGTWFGLKANGDLADPAVFNGYGIGLGLGAHHNRLGGSGESARNIISGSEEGAIVFTRGANHNVVSGNWIGLNSSGTGSSNPNSGYGIVILSGFNNRIGGSGTGERNIISDNRLTGIQLGRDPKQVFKDPLMDPANEACLNTVIEGNWIGTDRSGTQPVPNGRTWNGGGSAIEILNFTSGTVIGGAVLSKRNVISGNAGPAISVAGDTGTTTTVLGNRIGTTVDGLAGIPNQAAGIRFQGTSTLIAGGLFPGQGNQIAYNKGPGIDLTRMKSPASGVMLAGNLIHDNDRAGSVSLALRRPANDEGDADIGPNGLQNWPMPLSAVNQDGATLVACNLTTFARGVDVRVDAFAESGGGGKTFIGTRTVTTGSDPADRYVINAALQFVGGTVALMATTPDGSSEFSVPIKVVSGLDSDGDGIPDALERQVPITSGNGPRNPSSGDRNGDGIADETQANVASVQVPEEGAWITIASDPGTTITDVTGLRPVDVPSLPAGHVVQPGAVLFTLTGNAATSQSVRFIFPLLPAGSNVWLRDGSAWRQLTDAVLAPTGSLSSLQFTLPPRPVGSAWLLAIGHPAAAPSPPSIALSPPMLYPLGRLDFSSPLSLDGAGPVVPLSPLSLVQPVTVTLPPSAAQWTLQMTSDLNTWENIPSPDPDASEISLTLPLQPGARFFRWMIP